MDQTKRYFTNDDNANLIYFQFPKLLMYGEDYKKMSSDAKLFYTLCLDLVTLSMKKGWKDEHGRYYIKLSLETIKDRMNCQNTKAVNLKKELTKYNLLEPVRIGQGKADRLYVLQLAYTDEDIYRANNDHEDIENDEEVASGDVGTQGAQGNSENQSSSTPQNGGQELRKSETIKKDSFKNYELRTKPKNINTVIDDDKRTPSGDSAQPHDEESVNNLISNLREETKDELSGRSFKAVVRKVMDKYNQGKVGNLRDYLVTALANKIYELELRKAKDQAKVELLARKERRIEQRKQQLEDAPYERKIPFYDWTKE